MNKKILIIAGVIIILAAGALLFLRGDEDTWLCQNGQWVKHGNPSAPMPTSGCGNPVQEPDIVVTAPTPNQTITNPLNIGGKAKGTWYFEAVAPVRLVDDKENTLAEGQIQAQGDWMTESYVPFKTTLTFVSPSAVSGKLIFQNDNPSGDPSKDKTFEVPVQINTTNNQN